MASKRATRSGSGASFSATRRHSRHAVAAGPCSSELDQDQVLKSSAPVLTLLLVRFPLPTSNRPPLGPTPRSNLAWKAPATLPSCREYVTPACCTSPAEIHPGSRPCNQAPSTTTDMLVAPPSRSMRRRYDSKNGRSNEYVKAATCSHRADSKTLTIRIGCAVISSKSAI